MHDGFLRVASATPTIQVANCPYNAQQIIAVAKQAAEKQVSAIVFPELCLTGYTCGDLFFQQTLLTSALNGLETILKELNQEDIICIVGLPIRVETNLYNCAAVCYHGKLLGIVPKTNLVDQGGLNETRYFCTAPGYREIMLCNQTVPFGTNIIFSCDTLTEFQFGVEICKDIWVTEPPSNVLAKEGATVIFNLSASTEVVGRAAYRKTLVTGQSAKLICAYVYADAGQGESTTDYVYSGHDLIAENGTILAESPLFYTGFIDADIDLQLLWQERCHTSCWNHVSTPSYQKVRFFSAYHFFAIGAHHTSKSVFTSSTSGFTRSLRIYTQYTGKRFKKQIGSYRLSSCSNWSIRRIGFYFGIACHRTCL